MTDEQLHKVLDCVIIKRIIVLSPHNIRYLMKKTEMSCISKDIFSHEKYLRFLMNKSKKSPKEIETIILKADDMVKEILEFDDFKNIIDKLLHLLSNLKVKTGICSLSEKNNNQVMWTMYAGKYEGYCIEYDFTDEVSNPNFLDSVLYKSERKFNIFEFLTAIVMNAFLEEKIQKHNHSKILK